MTPSRSGQYVTGMCIAGLGVCAGGWLVVTAAAFDGPPQASAVAGGKWTHAALAMIATGAGLALIAAVTFACWAIAWRRVLRTDGVLFAEARRRARRDARFQARAAARAAKREAAEARRQARMQTREAIVQAREEERQAREEERQARLAARQATREARAMGKRDRTRPTGVAEAEVNVALDHPVAPDDDETDDEKDTVRILPQAQAAGFGEPDGVRPPNADRVLAQLRDLLGPLITALEAEPPEAEPPEGTVPAAREAHEPREQQQVPREPQRAEPPGALPQGAQQRSDSDLVAVCADGVISYDAEEAW
jgi:hypothetical protein